MRWSELLRISSFSRLQWVWITACLPCSLHTDWCIIPHAVDRGDLKQIQYLSVYFDIILPEQGLLTTTRSQDLRILCSLLASVTADTDATTITRRSITAYCSK